jgi:CheY-like chemotaxis protein
VALTANAMSEMRDFFLERGFSDYLTKPIEPGLLDTVLARWIPQEKQGEVLAQPGTPSGGKQESEPEPKRASGLAGGAARAALAAQHLDLLNHYLWHFVNGLPVDGAYYDEFCALVENMDVPPPMRGEMAALAAAGRRGDAEEIRRVLPTVYETLAEQGRGKDGAGIKTGGAGASEEMLKRLKVALDEGDSQGLEAAMDALRDMGDLSPEVWALYSALNDALLMDETEKASAQLEAYENGRRWS